MLLRAPIFVVAGLGALALLLPAAVPAAGDARPQKPRIRYVIAAAGPAPAAATFGIAIDTSGQETTYFIEYGVSAAYGSQTASETLPAQPRPGTAIPTVQEVRTTAAGLKPGATYHYRVVARNATGEVRSGDRTFVSGGKPPQVSRGFERPAREVTSIVVGATIDTGELETTYLVRYGRGFRLATPPATLPAVPSPGSWRSTAREARVTIKGLTPGVKLPYRIIATNAIGSAVYKGELQAAARKAPISSVVSEYGATPTSAIVAATVDTGGLLTTYYVEYTRPGRKARTAKTTLRALPGKGWSPTSTEVRIPLTGLAPDTRYTYRLVVANASGTASSRHSLVTGGRKPSLSFLYAVAGRSPSSVTIGAGTFTGALPSSYYVEYGPTAGYGLRSSVITLLAIPSPNVGRPDSGEIRIELDGIRPAQAYHYRLVATNAVGTLRSSDRTFELK
jgi:phosphodiesterase/alkaline phosphatase D-like protein